MSERSEVEALRPRLRDALRRAMKTRDPIAVAALRSALSAIDNAEAVDPSHAPAAGQGPIAGAVSGLGAGEVARRVLSEREIEEIVEAEVASRRSAAADFEQLARRDDATRLRAEAAVLNEYLDH